jgi:hypothetical protein
VGWADKLVLPLMILVGGFCEKSVDFGWDWGCVALG